MESSSPDRFIIAIGASAGGLEAIHEFFDHMPANSGFTFVVIQHLSPDYKSLLVELVSKHTHMQVFEAANDVTLQRDCVYIIPNKKLMTIRGHKLKLADKVKDKSPNTAIDTFLFTMAKEKKEKAIAIILSGTGTDGTKGIEAIKEYGGMVIVQDPATAKFDGMPNSAITSGNADHILAPAKMHAEVYNYVHQINIPQIEEGGFDDGKLNDIFTLVSKSSGHDFNLYKTPTILRRITRRMAAVALLHLEDYVALLHKDPAEVKLLAKDFLIGVTSFFRDKQAFELLEKEIIPNIVKKKNDGDILKVWVCACSTGEEAYSIAVLLNEKVEESGKNIEIKIFATDVDDAAIEVAARNCYPLTAGREIPEHLLKRYFIKDNKSYSVLPGIRKQIVFARHNVIKSPPFIKNDLVTCRNMLIYMNSLLQQKVVATFHYALNKEGYLFLGSSENAASIKEGVTEISSKWKIYQRSGAITYGLHHTYTAVAPGLKYDEKQIPVKNSDKPKSIDEEFRDLLIEEFGPVGIFIDKSYTVKETIGDFNRFLMMPEKKLDLNILNMVGKDVSIVLNTAIRKAWKEGKKAHIDNIKVKREKEVMLLQITVKPPDSRSPNGYTLVLFSENKAEPVKQGIVLPPVDGDQHGEYLMEMEAELSETRINLQMAVEEMETTNEELQSSNEELLSANEELQSGNEELQSLNEELHTLNTEHQLKIRELVELNDDLDNYFRSTAIGQIFIDANLRIRKFNPAAVKLINLIEADIGRPINHISNNILLDNLVNDLHTVLGKGKMIEKEVALKSGTNSLMRIMPYIRKDKQPDGAVITFVDISVITELNNMITGVFNANSSAILAFREIAATGSKPKDYKCIAFNQSALSLIDKTADDMNAQPSISEFPELMAAMNFEQYSKVAETGKPVQAEIQTTDGRYYQLSSAKMNDGFVLSLSDVTIRKNAEKKLKKNYNELITAREGLRNLNQQLEQRVQERTQKLAESEERFKLVSKATNDTVWDWNLVTNTMWRNENFTVMFGYGQGGESNNVDFWFSKIHPDDRKRVESSVYQAINKHETNWSAEYRILKADNTYAAVLDRGSILEDELQTPYRLVGSVVDITRLVETERRLSSSESKFKKVFESNLIGMLFATLDGEMLEANDAFLNMLGYTRNDLESKKLNGQEITPEEYLDISNWAVAQLKEHGVCPPFEKRYNKKNGGTVSVLMGSALLDDNDSVTSVSYIIDITLQKEAEAKRQQLQNLVQKQQAEFSDIFSNAPALISIRRGAELRYEFVNKAFAEFDGCENYQGKTVQELHPEFAGSELLEIEKQVFNTGNPYYGKSHSIKKLGWKIGDDVERWFDFVYTPVFADNGVIDGIAFFGFEVTELVNGRKATEELMHKKDEFMSIASHELKTPITSLKGSLQIVQRMIERNGEQGQMSRFIDKANSQTDKLTDLVGDLLDVTKIQEGKMLLNYSTFNAVEMVKDCVDDVKAQGTNHKLILQADCSINATADKARLEQVVHNFLTNAIKYSPDADTILISCSMVNESFKVSVKDFGIGIPDDKKPYIFDRFYRVQESSTHFSGLGLGLFISAEIVNRHNGHIGVDSTGQDGSTFWFTIPVR
ncbi:chemotaxis protein [Mucilaginibacter sp. PAMC 26640]|nr:chemotaxis protein [Mucilaginibacter sp. PAMC 26640]